MIELSGAVLIGKGSERLCYQHPENPDLCIKVRYRVKRSRNESEREFDYASSLKRGEAVPLALPIEWVETNEGIGLICPLVRDDNGQLSQSLQNWSGKPQLAELFDEFAKSILANHLSVTDLRMQNLVVQQIADKARIVMIDGYGFTNDFLKYAFKVTRLITHIQTKRRLEKFRRNYIHDRY